METVATPGAVLAGLLGGFFLIGGIPLVGLMISRHRRRRSDRAGE
jgi:hypothetical protein